MSKVGALAIHAVILMALLGGCECEDDDIRPWELGPREVVEDVPSGEPTPSEEALAPVVERDHGKCREIRELIRGLEIVDDATIERTPEGLVIEIHETDGRNRVQSCWVKFYDERGRNVVSVQNFYAPNTPESIYWYRSFDEDSGRPTEYRGDLDGDGVFDQESRTGYRPDGQAAWSSIDEDLDGEHEWYTEVFYNDLDQRIGSKTTQFGVVVQTSETEYDASGNEVLSRGDGDGDGALDWIWETEYDDDGRRIGFLRKTLVEGEWHTIRESLTYDQQGIVVEWWRDNEDDGTVDIRGGTDLVGETQTDWVDDGDDGVLDHNMVTKWREYPRSRKTIHEDWGADGTWDSLRRWHVDDEGRDFAIDFISDVESGAIDHRQITVFGVGEGE